MANSKLMIRNPITRIRQHHALEHATLQVLSITKNVPLAGYSDPFGFWIVGDVTTQEIQEGVEEAMTRLKAGEYRLALHPNCGTNYVVSGVIAGGVSWLAMLGSNGNFRRKMERLPIIMTLVTVSLILTTPLALTIQARYTTDPNLGTMEVKEITTHLRGRIPYHRILTRM
jgi:Domain of unknown function (DUF6391)